MNAIKNRDILFFLLLSFIIVIVFSNSKAYAETFSIADATITGYQTTYSYEGKEITPNISVRLGDKSLEEDVNYIVDYCNNINVGNATIIITGIGEYEGQKSVNFSINKANFKQVIQLGISDQYYTGENIEPEIPLYNPATHIKLKKDIDYTVVYYGNRLVGSNAYAKVISNGVNYSSGELYVYFSIVLQKMENCTIDYVTPVLYDGTEKKPDIIVRSNGIRLSADNYKVTYTNNINIGTGLVTVEGLKNCTGINTTTFQIKGEIQEADVIVSNTAFSLNRIAKPNVLVKNGDTVLEQDKDYKIILSNNVVIGTGNVTIIGCGNYTGTVDKNFLIKGRSVKQLQYSDVGAYKYIKEYICPEINIKFIDYNLVENVDYEISYKKNKLPGYGQIIVKGKGNYRNVKVIEFKIKPPEPSLKEVKKSKSGIKLNWTKAPSNCKYEVYRNGKRIATVSKCSYKDTKKLTKGKKYSYTIKTICMTEYKNKKIKLSSELSNCITINA